MHLTYRNAETAFHGLVTGMANEFPMVRTDSRAGPVLMIRGPVLVTYERPQERVVFNVVRDANPFFHLYEALWMLAGRNDVAPLTYYNSKIAEIASDDGVTFNGAYGKRWSGGRRQLYVSEGSPNQLQIIIDHLKQKPGSRRAVLQMWNVEQDLAKIDMSKDVCCNTAVYFAIENGRLDMTVTNRSNDVVWGMLGANVVTFSILQEYMAAAIGVEMGLYHQFTNNLHAYTERWRAEDWIRAGVTEYPGAEPLVHDPAAFITEVERFVERHSRDAIAGMFTEPFLAHVAQPMMIAFHNHKRKQDELALQILSATTAPDWRLAATAWIERRMK